MKNNPLQLTFILLSGLVLLFILAPLAGMFLSTTAGRLFDTLGEAEVRDSIWLTLWTSMMATLVFSVAAIPFAYLLARKSFPMKKLVSAIIDRSPF